MEGTEKRRSFFRKFVVLAVLSILLPMLVPFNGASFARTQNKDPLAGSATNAIGLIATADAVDPYETQSGHSNDDTVAYASQLTLNAQGSGSQPGHLIEKAGDVDWVKFTIPGPGTETYLLQTSKLNYNAFTSLSIYRASTMVLVADDNDDKDYGPSTLIKTKLDPGNYLIKLQHASSDTYGDGTDFDLEISKAAAIGAPQKVNATQRVGQIDITWDAPLDNPYATYRVYRAVDTSAFPADYYAETWCPGYTDYDVGSSHTYNYWVTAKDDFGFESSPVQATPPNLRPGTPDSKIGGKVTDLNGNPLQGIIVIAENEYFSHTAVTSITGGYSLDVVAGSYAVKGHTKSGFETEDQYVEAPANGVDFSLFIPPLKIAGTIKNYNDKHELVTITANETASGIHAWLDCSDNPEGFSAHSIPDNKGYFELAVITGAYNIGANTIYGCMRNQDLITVNYSNSPVRYDLFPPVMGSISGKITVNGVELPDAMVYAVGPNATEGNCVFTDLNGQYSMLVPGNQTYEISLWDDIYGQIVIRNALTVSGTANITGVNLNIHTGTVNVKVQDPQGNPVPGSSVYITNNIAESEATDSDGNVTFDVPIPQAANLTEEYTVEVVTPDVGSLDTQDVGLSQANPSADLTFQEPAASTFAKVQGIVHSNSQPLEEATVIAQNKETLETTEVQTDGNGTYSLDLTPGDYDIYAWKTSYSSSDTQTLSVVAGGVDNVNFDISECTSSLSGQVYIEKNGKLQPAAQAMVWATNEENGYASAQADANGFFSLDVTAGDWFLQGRSKSHYTASEMMQVTAPQSDIELKLDIQDVPTNLKGKDLAPIVQALVPSKGRILSDNATGIEVIVPGGALGKSNKVYTLSAEETGAVPDTPVDELVGGSAADFSALDDQGEDITNTDTTKDVIISLRYDDKDLKDFNLGDNSGKLGYSKEANLKLGYFNKAKGRWDRLDSAVDTKNHRVRARIRHFSTFGILAPVGQDLKAPKAPVIAKVKVNQNPPGKNDTVQGSSGAVEVYSTVKIYSDSALKKLIGKKKATRTGSFAAVSIGNNRYSNVWITATDVAGNQSKSIKKTNDIAKPNAKFAALGVRGFVAKKGCTIKFRLFESAAMKVKATLSIKSGKATVKTLFKNRMLKASKTGILGSVKWNGKNTGNKFVKKGSYLVELILTDLAGNRNVVRMKIKAR